MRVLIRRKTILNSRLKIKFTSALISIYIRISACWHDIFVLSGSRQFSLQNRASVLPLLIKNLNRLSINLFIVKNWVSLIACSVGFASLQSQLFVPLHHTSAVVFVSFFMAFPSIFYQTWFVIQWYWITYFFIAVSHNWVWCEEPKFVVLFLLYKDASSIVFWSVFILEYYRIIVCFLRK